MATPRPPEDDLQRIHGQLPELLGFRILTADRDSAEAVLMVGLEHRRIGGVVHGGVLFLLADAVAANLAVQCFAPHGTTTTDAGIRFLAAAAGTEVRANARVLHAGSRTRWIEVRLTDEHSGLVAVYHGNFIRQSAEAPATGT
ncbi:MAG: PaaI family thioesterase [Planctomycetes bacterium]|nr:PaaI family thioesterase [Planctomycetota bacterium]MCB9868787.1 PaaI family thioesterase [Planctomycetota bacterium]